MSENQVKLSRNEGLKSGNPLLSGTIASSLANPAADHFSEDDYEFLKFHGAYQQDDRDKRKVAKHYMLMVRTKFPGGVLTSAQYLVCERLANTYGSGTLRITTRQDFQFHGILKSNLRQHIRELNQALVTTIAACGDVNRNVVAPPTPSTNTLTDVILQQAKAVSDSLAPATPAYHSIWLEGKEIDLSHEAVPGFVDPIYGKSYLPRKFKIGFAVPPLNDVDVLTNDLGFIAIEQDGTLAGYNVVAGGGLGMSHGNPQTFPRLADVVGFIAPEHVPQVARAVVTIHRDFGDRANRKHARLKYVIHERGVDWFRSELEQRTGVRMEAARPFRFTAQGDLLGWHRQSDGKFFLGLFVENGRILDVDGYRLKSALRAIAERYAPELRLTPSQNVLLVNVAPEHCAGIDHILGEHGVSPTNPFTRTRKASMACPALPTCGLALAESERAFPDFISELECLLIDLGLQDEEITVRMTGCPNGCARPYTAELALVGKAPGKYQIYLGGNEASTRLNRLFADSVKREELVSRLHPVLLRFARERAPGERLGDFCHRVLWTEAVPAPAVA